MMEWNVFSLKKEKILPFVTTWITQEGIMLSEVNHREKTNAANTAWYRLHGKLKFFFKWKS